jgi:4-amino-4-deoxy-L-arabinose transferase-like glycosyltransferase
MRFAAAPAAALLVLALAWFCNLDYRSIIKADEGRYAEIAREMVATGDWLTPRLNGFKYFEKPALQHWMTAAAFALFGVNEWTARLWTAVTGFLAVVLVWRTGNRAFGRPAGLYAAAVLASSVLWVALGHFLSLDMGVAFFMTLAVLAFMVSQLDTTPAPGRMRWMLVAWAAMAFAVLSKGLIGVVLPVAAVVSYILVQRDWARLRRLQLVSGLALFLVIAAPWFIAVSLANEEFFGFFFIHEHVERFLTRVHGRYEPPWYFVPVLAAGLMPWLLAAFPALWHGWKADSGKTFRPARFLMVWCAVVFVFFSASSSKLPPYVLPIVPAVALLIGRYLPQASRPLMIAQAILSAVIGVVAWLVAAKVELFAEDDLPEQLLAGYAPWIGAAGTVLVVAALGALARSHRVHALSLAAGGLAFTQLIVTGHEALSPAYSAYHVVQRIRPALQADARFYERGIPFYFVNTFDHSLPFYLGRTVTMVAYKDELAVPIGWEPDKFLPDIDAFVRAWSRDGRAYAVVAPADFELLRQRGDMVMEIVASDPRRMVIRK